MLISAENLVFKTKLLVSTALSIVILFKLTFYTSYFSIIISFLTTSFLTTLLNLPKSVGVVFNLSTSILSTSVF